MITAFIVVLVAYLLFYPKQSKESLDCELKRARIAREKANLSITLAREAKIKRDQEVLESRQAKIDSEVAILELRIDEMRHAAGYDHPFKPNNY